MELAHAVSVTIEEFVEVTITTLKSIHFCFRIVVSAPYGQAPNAVLQRTNNDDPTGVIYTCPISPGRCEGLAGDNTGDARRLNDVDG